MTQFWNACHFPLSYLSIVTVDWIDIGYFDYATTSTTIFCIHSKSNSRISFQLYFQPYATSCRSRKLNTQLETAIQEAMADLDRAEGPNHSTSAPSAMQGSEQPPSSPAPFDVYYPLPMVSTSPRSTAIGTAIVTTPSSKTKRRITRATTAQQRKLIKIAPAPLNNNKEIQVPTNSTVDWARRPSG